jgi:hypothetical protein
MDGLLRTYDIDGHRLTAGRRTINRDFDRSVYFGDIPSASTA